MSIINRYGRALLLAALLGGGSLFLLTGCVVDPEEGTGSNCTSAETCKQVTIGGQTWMAENLNIKTSSGSYCYNDSGRYCAEFGRLYIWDAAMRACPNGWHLPSREDWQTLVDYALNYNLVNSASNYSVGAMLKSKKSGGEDIFGFSALPGGWRDPYGYQGLGRDGRFGDGDWWTATTDDYVSDNAYRMNMSWIHDGVNENAENKSAAGFSVRCIAD